MTVTSMNGMAFWILLFGLLLSSNCIGLFMFFPYLNISPPQSPLSRISHSIRRSWALQVAYLHRLFKNGNWMGCSQKSCRKSFSAALLWVLLYSWQMKEVLLSHYGAYVAATWWLAFPLNAMFYCGEKLFNRIPTMTIICRQFAFLWTRSH